MTVKIIGLSSRIAWYAWADADTGKKNQLGKTFEATPYTGKFAEPGDIQVTAGNWKGYLIAANDYETLPKPI